MIFLDETGKRWRRIKRSSAVATAAIALPVGVLLAGSLVYQPHWGVLPLVKHAAGQVLSGSVQAPSGHTTTKPKTTAVRSKSATSTKSSATTTAPASTISGASATPLATPAASSAPVPAATPTQSAFGHSHQPTH